MPLTEFDIIARYFNRASPSREDVVLGIGDDAALIAPPAGQQLAIAIDTLVAGVHFPCETDPYDIGWKALAVNLSDLAAMGAEPAWFTLALTLAQNDDNWLAEFSQGLSDLAGQSGVQLVGGDTTHGPLSVTIQVGGYVPAGQALTRSGARAGDAIWVSGTLGDAALGLQLLQGEAGLNDEDSAYLQQRLNRPRPRQQLGLALREIARSCIDISDGLLADLGHLCNESQLGATLESDAVPLSGAAQRFLADHPEHADLPLSGGDDYELCFTASAGQEAPLQALAAQLQLPLSRIGVMKSEPGIDCLDAQGQRRTVAESGYRHFGASS